MADGTSMNLVNAGPRTRGWELACTIGEPKKMSLCEWGTTGKHGWCMLYEKPSGPREITPFGITAVTAGVKLNLE